MIGALAALPWLLKRWQAHRQAGAGSAAVSAQVLSSVGIGPGQRVVTVEVGHGSQTVCLVLGVTAQNIHCLHVLPSSQGAASAALPATSFASAMAQVQHGAQSAAQSPSQP